MSTGVDAAVAVDEYSVPGRTVEINGVPYEGLPEITGGGVTKEALVAGFTGSEAWMDIPIVIVHQTAPGNPLAPPHTETMVVSVMSWQSETPGGGEQSKCTIVWKQHALPQL